MKARKTSSASVDKIAHLFDAAITPSDFRAWCDQLAMPEADAMRREFQALIDQEAAKLREGDVCDVVTDGGDNFAIRSRLSAGLSAAGREDLRRMYDGLLVEAEARATVSFRVGITIGKILGRLRS